MSDHKFKAGQLVRLLPGLHVADARVTFKIVGILPSEHGINQYRIKSETDGQERVVVESEGH